MKEFHVLAELVAFLAWLGRHLHLRLRRGEIDVWFVELGVMHQNYYVILVVLVVMVVN